MYRNLTFFRFPASVAAAILELATRQAEGSLGDCLAEHAMKPVGPLELSSRGWVPLHSKGPLFRRLGDTIHLALGGEDKVLPAPAVNRELRARLEAYEKREGRRPGTRARKAMRDEVLQDLLPRALVKPYRLDGYLDLSRGLLVVDTASRKAAEGFASHLRATLGSFPALPLNAEVLPRAVLTNWLAGADLPEGGYDGDRETGGALILGDACRLQDPADGGGVVTAKGEELLSDEIAQHLAAGKQCTRLGLCMDDRLAFNLGEDLVVRGLKFLDGAVESLESFEADDLQAELDARAALLVGEVGRLFDVLERALKLSKVEG